MANKVLGDLLNANLLDGDTVETEDGERVRINHIDTSEVAKSFGPGTVGGDAAWQAAEDYASDPNARIVATGGKDIHGRTLGDIMIEGREPLSEHLVRTGHAAPAYTNDQRTRDVQTIGNMLVPMEHDTEMANAFQANYYAEDPGDSTNLDRYWSPDGTLSKGIRRGLDQTQLGIAYLLDDEEAISKNVEELRRNQAEIGSIKNIGDVGDAFTWGLEVLGSQLPQLAVDAGFATVGAVSGGLGASGIVARRSAMAAMKKTLQQGIQEGIEQTALRQAALQAGQQAAANHFKKVAATGAKWGGASGIYLQSVGESMSNLREDGGEYLESLATSLGISVPQAALEYTGLARALGDLSRATGLSKDVVNRTMASRFGEMAKTMGVEGATESMQTVIDMAANLQMNGTPFDLEELMNAAAAGAFIGGVFSGAGHLVGGGYEAAKAKWQRELSNPTPTLNEPENTNPSTPEPEQDIEAQFADMSNPNTSRDSVFVADGNIVPDWVDTTRTMSFEVDGGKVFADVNQVGEEKLTEFIKNPGKAQEHFEAKFVDNKADMTEQDLEKAQVVQRVNDQDAVVDEQLVKQENVAQAQEVLAQDMQPGETVQTKTPVEAQVARQEGMSEQIVDPDGIDYEADEQSTTQPVNVWYGSGENARLSNLAYRPFEYGGRNYGSVEHAYQTLKSGVFDAETYNNPNWREGRKIAGRKGTDRKNSQDLMERLVEASFEQNPKDAKILVETGDRPITHAQDRGHWREGFPAALMKTREKLKSGTEAELDAAQDVDATPEPSQTEQKVLGDLINGRENESAVQRGTAGNVSGRRRNATEESPRATTSAEVVADDGGKTSDIIASSRPELVEGETGQVVRRYDANARPLPGEGTSSKEQNLTILQMIQRDESPMRTKYRYADEYITSDIEPHVNPDQEAKQQSDLDHLDDQSILEAAAGMAHRESNKGRGIYGFYDKKTKSVDETQVHARKTRLQNAFPFFNVRLRQIGKHPKYGQPLYTIDLTVKRFLKEADAVAEIERLAKFQFDDLVYELVQMREGERTYYTVQPKYASTELNMADAHTFKVHTAVQKAIGNAERAKPDQVFKAVDPQGNEVMLHAATITELGRAVTDPTVNSQVAFRKGLGEVIGSGYEVLSAFEEGRIRADLKYETTKDSRSEKKIRDSDRSMRRERKEMDEKDLWDPKEAVEEIGNKGYEVEQQEKDNVLEKENYEKGRWADDYYAPLEKQIKKAMWRKSKVRPKDPKKWNSLKSIIRTMNHIAGTAFTDVAVEILPPREMVNKDWMAQVQYNFYGAGQHRIAFNQAILDSAPKHELMYVAIHEFAHLLSYKWVRDPEYWGQINATFKSLPKVEREIYGKRYPDPDTQVMEWATDQVAMMLKEKTTRTKHDHLTGKIRETFDKITSELKSFYRKMAAFLKKTGVVKHTNTQAVLRDLLKQGYFADAHVVIEGATRTDSNAFTLDPIVDGIKQAHADNPTLKRKMTALHTKFKQAWKSDAGRAFRFIFDYADNILRDIDPELASWFNKKIGTSGRKGYIQAKDGRTLEFHAEIDALVQSMGKEEFERAATELQSKSKNLSANAQKLKQWYDNFYDNYAKPNMPTLGRVKDAYFTKVYEPSALIERPEDFERILFEHFLKKNPKQQDYAWQLARETRQRIIDATGVFELEFDSPERAQGAKNIANLTRELDFSAEHEQRLIDGGYVFEDKEETMKYYVMQSVKRGEFERMFHTYEKVKGFPDPITGEDIITGTLTQIIANQPNLHRMFAERFGVNYAEARLGKKRLVSDDKLIDFLVETGHLRREGGQILQYHPGKKLSDKIEDIKARDPIQARDVMRILSAYQGRLGADMNPKLRRTQSWAIVVQSYLTLAFTAFASLPDFAGIVMRGRDLPGMVASAKGMMKAIREYPDKKDLARTLGMLNERAALAAIQSRFGAETVDPKAAKALDTLFKYNGQEALTNFSRIMAVSAAETVLAQLGQRNDAEAQRYLSELNLTADEVNAWQAGTLDMRKAPKIRDAIRQFTDESILRPNATMRPVWASDPRFAIIWHLKSFVYAFGKVIMGGAIQEMRNSVERGNVANAALQPVVMGATFLPLAAVGLFLRGLIQYDMWEEDDENLDPYEQMSGGAYLNELVKRAGMWGPFELAMQFSQQDGVDDAVIRLAGPTIDHLHTLLSADRSAADKFSRSIPLWSQLYGAQDRFLG